MSTVKVLNDNFLEFSGSFGSTFTYSSQDTAAPATNILDMVRRSRVWRSAGQWEIVTGNKAIVFREAVGVDLTANIAVATYDNDTSFLTAIKTALEVAGAATYTVSRDSTTGKITIASGLDGGATVFQLRCNDVGFTSAAILGYSTASNLTGAASYTADSLKIHTSENMRWDFGTAVNPKAFVLVGPRNEPIKISETATIKLQGSSTDVWTSPAYETTLDYHERSIFKISDTGLHTVGLRYWRLYIIDASNPNGYVEISNLYLGDLFTATEGAVQFPLKETEIDPSDVVTGRGGAVYSDMIEQTSKIDFNWQYLSITEAETLRDFIRLVGQHNPFFVALDPDEVFSSDGSTRVHYCRFNTLPSVDLDLPNKFSSDWSVREEV